MNVMLLHVRNQGLGGFDGVWLNLDLVDDRFDVGVFEQDFEVVHLETSLYLLSSPVRSSPRGVQNDESRHRPGQEQEC